MTSRWIIWTVIILMGFVPHHVMAQESGNIEINLDVIKRFEKPAPAAAPQKAHTQTITPRTTAKAQPIKKAAPLPGSIPAPSHKLLSVYPDGTPKTTAVLEYEQSLRELREKYFPARNRQPLEPNSTQEKSQIAEHDAPVKPPKPIPAPRTSKLPKTLAPAPQKVEPIPAPSYPPPRTSKVTSVSEEPIAEPIAQEKKSADTPETAQIMPQHTSGDTSDTRAPSPAEIKGLKIVSIAYMDEEITLNTNVKDALISTYIPRLKAQKSYRIGLYSYSSVINRSDKQARSISLERAIALKDFLIDAGVDKKRIDIFPAGKSEQASFSDWIDIILQK